MVALTTQQQHMYEGDLLRYAIGNSMRKIIPLAVAIGRPARKAWKHAQAARRRQMVDYKFHHTSLGLSDGGLPRNRARDPLPPFDRKLPAEK